MASPPTTEDHRPEDPIYTELASTATGPHDSKDSTEATTQTQASALPPQPLSAKFAIDEDLFDSTPVAATAIQDDDHDEDLPYPEEEGSLLPPPDFKPFFTLIEDTETGEHHHPTVHYLFADDDQEILTAAALETVSDEHHEPADERFVIVDMSSEGREVVSVSSLSPDWQTLKTKVTQAPSWGDESKTGERGLMLRISGQEAENGNDKRRKADVDGLLKAFDDLAGTLDGVLGLSTVTTDTQVMH
jgi:hypothetical protein